MKKLITLVSASLLPFAAFATNQIYVPTKNSLSNFIGNFVNWFEGIVLIISILFLLYAAFLFITAAGNEEKISKAKSIIVYGMIGVAVALLAFGIQTFIASILV